MTARSDADVYRDAMYSLGEGLALYEPSPAGYHHVRVGDVGFVKGGRFKRLFNVCFEADSQANKESLLPDSYQAIGLDFRAINGPWSFDAGIRASNGIRTTSATITAEVNTTPANIPLSAGVEYTFTSGASHGAILAISENAIKYDADCVSAFSKYIEGQSNTLQRLIDRKQWGIELHEIIIVTECCLASDWAIMVDRNTSSSSTFGLTFAGPGVNILGSASRYSSTEVLIPLHQFPLNPPPSSSIGRPLLQDDQTYLAVDGTDGVLRNQCIFLKGFRAQQRIKSILGIKMKAAAGPHELPKPPPPSTPSPAVVSSENISEVVILDESFNNPRKTDIYQRIFDHIFEHSDTDLAILHDDVVCRVAADGWKLDNLMQYLHEHAVACEKDRDPVNELAITDNLLLGSRAEDRAGEPHTVNHLASRTRPGSTESTNNVNVHERAHKLTSTDGSDRSPTRDWADVHDAPGRAFAYIICVDKYKSSQIKDLHCCKADGQKFSDFLTRRYTNVHIETISDEQATCENIRAIFEVGPPQGLLQKDDLLVFFYAGHGSRIEAPSDWKIEDGSVEVLCPYDAENGQNVLHNFVVNHLLQKLAQEYPNIVLVIDSCHAAGNARDQRDSVSRYTHFNQVLPRNMSDEYHQIFKAKRWGSSTEAGSSDNLSPFVVLAACGQHESAYETRSETTMSPGGHFTTALIKLLSEMPSGGLSYATLTKSLPKLPHQTPECVGATNRLVFSLDRASDEGLYFDIEPKGTSYIVRQAGSMLGITAGTVFSVRKRDNPKDLGTMTVTSVDVGFCIATAATPTTGESPIFPSAAKAYLHSWSYNDGALKISVGIGISFPLSQAEKYAVLVESPEEADIVLVKDGTGISVERCNSLIATRTRAPCVRLGTVADQEGLGPILAAIAHFHYHLLREGISDPFKEQITVQLHRLIREMSATGPRWQSSSSDPIEPDNESQISLTHSDSTCYGIMLENNSPHDLYPFLFYFDPSDYTIQQLYPRRGHALPRVAPLRSNEQLPIGYGNSEVGPLEFHLNDGEQFDAGFLKLFFCTSPVKMETISQKPFGVGAKRHLKEREEYIPQSTWDAKMITICVERS